MECNELLALLTAGAVAPYLAEAAVRWISGSIGYKTDSGAPDWCCRQRKPAKR